MIPGSFIFYQLVFYYSFKRLRDVHVMLFRLLLDYAVHIAVRGCRLTPIKPLLSRGSSESESGQILNASCRYVVILYTYSAICTSFDENSFNNLFTRKLFYRLSRVR